MIQVTYMVENWNPYVTHFSDTKTLVTKFELGNQAKRKIKMMPMKVKIAVDLYCLFGWSLAP